MTYLFNKSLNDCCFPSPWKNAHIIPIFKKNDKREIKNYRPVSLLSNIGKCMERIIHTRMYNHFCAHNLLTWRNSGFKKSDSTINQLIYLVHQIHVNMEKGLDTCMVFLDASKAFDRIWHQGLLHKLIRSGVSQNFSHWFESYLNNRRFRVTIDGVNSSWHDIYSGVPQGSILGPLLFLIYANDIIESLECEAHLYADDTSLLQPIDPQNPGSSLRKIETDLTTMCQWAEDWYMEFNPDKTLYMIFTQKGTHYPAPHMNGKELRQVDTIDISGLPSRLICHGMITLTVQSAEQTKGQACCGR